MFNKSLHGEYIVKTMLLSALIIALISACILFPFVITRQIVGGASTLVLASLGTGFVAMLVAFIATIIVGIVLSNLIWLSGNRLRSETLRLIAHIVFVIVVGLAQQKFWQDTSTSYLTADRLITIFPVFLVVIFTLAMFFVHRYVLPPEIITESSSRKRKEKSI